MNILDKICATKAEHVKAQKEIISLDALKEKISSAQTPRGFLKALQQKQPAIIAEVKKASPSRGVIRHDFNPVELAVSYEESGATCLSVLTDAPYFQGHDDYLADIKKAVRLPVLRKDFMIDPYQIYESRALNADSILLIMAALTDQMALEMHGFAKDLGMDVLVEVHDEAELERAVKLKPDMVGINNRNLKTMEVSLETSHRLAALVPGHILKISESGIANPNDIKDLRKTGFTAFLIGEAFMKNPNNGAALQEILKPT